MSVSIQRILEIFDRAHNGPLCSKKKWDNEVIPTKVAQKLKEHKLLGTCDRENPVNTDDELADEFYRAGFELAVSIGMLCQDTERIIEITEQELKEAIENAPSELVLGEGIDRVVLKHRRPEDKHPPLTRGAVANHVSEDIWVPVHQGIVQNRDIDMFNPGFMVTIFGRSIPAGTPYETLAGRYEAELTREVLWRAGRPGMPVCGVTTSATAFGQLGGFGISGGLNPATGITLILAPGELHTAYATLHKIAHAVNCGANIYLGFASMIGGSAGPAEGAALVLIAGALLQHAIHQAHISGIAAHDLRYNGSSGRHGLWAQSMARQALSRNTDLLGKDIPAQVAGPCTEMQLYECATTYMAISASGGDCATMCRGSGSKYQDYTTPLEHKFSAEVLKRSAGMTRKEVNRIINVLLPKYEENLHDPPKGRSVRECYDLKALRPAREWLDIYHKVKNELIDLGVPLK